VVDITQDDEDGKRHGVKNMVYENRMNLNSNQGRPCYYIHPSEVEAFTPAADVCRFIGTAIHELIGHGTGKLLTETAPGKFNFDHKDPPISPVTGKHIQTWYRPGETWVSVFGKLAPTVEECRAFLVASYLVDNKGILSLFGYDQKSTPTADYRECLPIL
jgi:dipeptidyl-peptidase III